MCPQSITNHKANIFHDRKPIYSKTWLSQNSIEFKMTITKIFEIKFPYITNDPNKTINKHHIYHYSTPREMVICDTNTSNTNFFNKLLSFLKY
jgi:hypothetical protein